MSRKRCKRRVIPTPAIPITFALQRKHVIAGNLMLRSALDAVLSHTGNDEHIAALHVAALYSMAACDRLARDRSVEPEQIEVARSAAVAGADAVAAVQERFKRTGAVGCAGPERDALRQLVDVNEQLDHVTTRRQSRDVMLALLAHSNAPQEIAP